MSYHERFAQVAQRKWAKKFWLKKSKILFNYVLFTVFKKKISKKWAHHSFPLFWWAMWVYRSFHSNQMSDVSNSLISLTKNERPWAICLGRSEEMSDHERIAQVGHQKWANEWIAHFWTKNEQFAQKPKEQNRSPGKLITLIIKKDREWVNWSRLIFYTIESIFLSQKDIKFNGKHDDQIPNPDHSTRWHGWEFDLDLLSFDLSIFKKDQPLSNRSFDLSITKNDWFDWKTDDRIPNPA